MQIESELPLFKPKRIIIILLLTALLATLWIPIVPSGAAVEAAGGGGAATGGSVQVGSPLDFNLNRWILDEPRGYIYAISTDANKLLFIRTSDLQVETEINIGSKPSDLDLDDGKLYVAISGGTLIKVVDPIQKTITREIVTMVSPYRLIAVGGKVYYTSVGSTWSVYEVRLSSDQNTQVTGMLHSSAIFAVDKVNQILYVGDTGSTGSNAKAYRVSDNTMLHRTMYDNGYGFGFPPPILIHNGSQLFYAGHKLDGGDLSVIYGRYTEPDTGYLAKIVAVTSQYVLSEQTLFDRESFKPIMKIPYSSSMLLMNSSNVIYGYDTTAKTIVKITPIMDQSSPITYSKSGNDTIVFDKALTGWTASPNGNYVYAVSKDANRLLYIRTNDWVVEKDIYIGSEPTDLTVVNGQVYVALSGSTFLGVADTVYGSAVTDSVYHYAVLSNPIRIAGGLNKLYYADSRNVHVVDAVYGKGKKLNELNNQLNYYNRDVLVDSGARVLYVDTDYGISKLNADTYAILNKADTLGFSTSKMILDGAYLYRGNKRISASVVSTVYGSYGSGGSNGDIIYAKGNYVFTREALYDRDSFNKITDLPDLASMAYMDDAGHIYLYMSLTKKAVKYDSVQSLIQQSPANQVPAYTVLDPRFNDHDAAKGRIGGTLYWSNPSNRNYITNYTVYFLDAQSRKIGDRIGVTDKNAFFLQIPMGTLVPEGAKYLGIFSKNDNGESQTSANVELVDYEQYFSRIYNTGVAVKEADPRRGQYDVTFRWIPMSTDMNEVKVELYFTDANRILIGEMVKEAPYGVTAAIQEVHMGIAPSNARYVIAKYRFADGSYDPRVDVAILFDNIAEEKVSEDVGKPGAPDQYSILLNFLDTDQQEQRLGGYLTYSSSSSNTIISGYVLYFLDKDDKRLQPVMEFSKPTNDQYDSSNMYWENNTAIPEGAVKLGIFPKNEFGEGTVGGVRTIWDLPYSQPSDMQFSDANPLKGISGAKLSWTTDRVESGLIKQYEIYYFNKNFTPFGTFVAKFAPGKERYEYDIPDRSIPSDAVYIGVLMRDLYDDTAPISLMSVVPITDRISDESIVEYPLNSNLPSPNFWGFTDLDGDPGELAGMMGWGSNISYGLDSLGYNVYFTDKDGTKIKPIVSVKHGYFTSSNAQIPMDTTIPAGAAGIAVYPWDGVSEGHGSHLLFTDNTYSSSPTVEQIQVVNNAEGTNDTLTVSGLTPGDRVKVYRNQTIGYPMAWQMAQGQSVSFSIPQLGKEAGSIYVTVHPLGEPMESRRVQKTYSAEPSTVSPGGGGCCFGGIGGTSTPSQQGEPGTYTPTTKTETSGDKTYEVAELDAAKLADVFKQAQQLGKSSIAIELKDAPNAKIQISAQALLSAASGSPGINVISVKSGNVSYDLPVALFDIEAIAKRLGIDQKDVNITVTIEQVSGDAAERIKVQAQRDGVTLLTTPVQFTITLGADSKQQSMNDFGNTYVTRTFVLAGEVDAAQATAVRIDPVTGELYFVPAVFETGEGQTEVRMMRQGNSIYAVAETKPRSFADLQGHWAKAEIELLAAKLIVKGATEDGFMPDRPITRAEFAALLVRSLGIAEEKNGSATFEDVPTNAWFAGSVAAAYDKGLVDGVARNMFHPNEPITREQMAVMISRALAMIGKQQDGANPMTSLSKFVDREAVSSWAQDAVSKVVQAGLMNGTGEERFAPSEQASRAQVAVMLKRLLQHVGFMN